LDSFAGIALASSLLAYGVFGLYLAGNPTRLAAEPRPGTRAMLLAVVGALAWTLAALTAELGDRSTRAWALPLASALDLLRNAAWMGLLLVLLRPGPLRRAWRPDTLAARVACGALALATLAWGVEIVRHGGFGPPGRTALLALLGLALAGLLLVEQLFRNVGEDARWSAKPLCLGIALMFGFDVYLLSEGLLFGALDDTTASARGAVHAMAVPLLYLTTRRQRDWPAGLQVSRRAAVYSATLVLAGAWLLLMAAIGYYVRWFGGQWGPALQTSLLVVGVAALAALVVSGSARSWLRVFVGKHFFRYRFDYREEWLRFTARLSPQGSLQDVGTNIVRGLADMVECPAGVLWARTGPDAALLPVARWNMPLGDESGNGEPEDSPFVRYLSASGWIVDLDEFRQRPAAYSGLELPPWLLASGNAWLVVPLHDGRTLLGFVVLSRPRTAIVLNWEVLDLLKTAARQAAGFVAQLQAAEALLEARKFDAFNRMSAFVVHDLKNIVTQLSLMLKNAQRHRANPEFQQDMLMTVESSLEKMRRLMLQLREGATPVGGGHGVELAPVARRIGALAAAQGRSLELHVDARLATRGHEDRLERVLGHLVQNAFDATPREGRVWLAARRVSGQVEVEVGDTGEGMSAEFVRTRLFRPFSTTKKTGMGIGAHESMQYIRELGGSIEVDSEPGRGTRMTVRLPVFESGAGSDLMPLAEH
jgi:putative PEP-CTERM system histidine kinase